MHGNCASCNESAGRYGFLAAAGINKTFDLPAAHSHVRVSMRIWQFDTWDGCVDYDYGASDPYGLSLIHI